MAKVIGESGAYRGVRDALREVGLQVESVDAIAPLRQELVAQRDRILTSGDAEFRFEANRLREEMEAVVRASEQSIAELDAACSTRQADLRFELSIVEAEVERIGSFRENLASLKGLFCWWRARARVRKARKALSTHYAEYLRTRRTAWSRPMECWKRLTSHLGNPAEFLRSRTRLIDRQLDCLSRLLDAGEVGGAAAELEVIGYLSALPGEWTVVNDVQLKSTDWFRYNGKALRTAQLDHVVVGPGGIFVIETKNWSRRFVEQGDFFDPYEQAARGAYLCHKMLSRSRLPCKTRSIIATRSRLPPKPQGSYAKILRPDEVCGFLCWFAPELAAPEIERVVAFLERFAKR